MKTASLCNKRKPTRTNVKKLKKTQRELTHTKRNKKNTFKIRSIK